MRRIPHPSEDPDTFNAAVERIMREEQVSRVDAEFILMTRAFRDRDDESENCRDD